MLDLGTLSGPQGVVSVAQAVNERGQVVGYSSVGAVGKHAFSWEKEAGMVDLGTLGGVISVARAVNARGQVVGGSTVDGDEFGGTWHAFLWTKRSGMVDLGTLGGTWSDALAVNERGQVVGMSAIAGDLATHAFSWTAKGGMVDLGTLGGPGSGAVALNDEGQVVGTSDVLAPANDGRVDLMLPPPSQHAFSWTEECGMVDLGTLGGAVSYPYGLNARGQVVGDSLTGAADSQMHATLWEPQRTSCSRLLSRSVRANPAP
jgi:probable HAF family extracellular repeat protein